MRHVLPECGLGWRIAARAAASHRVLRSPVSPPPEKRLRRARPPTRLVITINVSRQNGAGTPGRGR
eukprot:7674341-Alexandrium_andersonii.AAC.1